MVPGCIPSQIRSGCLGGAQASVFPWEPVWFQWGASLGLRDGRHTSCPWSKTEWSFLTSFLLPFTLNFLEDGEEKEAAKCTGWRSQSGEDARIRESITEEGDWGGNGEGWGEKPWDFWVEELGMSQKVVGELGRRRVSPRNMVGLGCVEIYCCLVSNAWGYFYTEESFLVTN